ncbi:MAG: BNR-repeat neuraminidase N-terminal domain-containing protein [Bacteroidia bacterium]
MSHRYPRIKTSNRLKTSAKLVLGAAGVTLAGIVTLLIIFFNLSKQENSFGESLMVFQSADVVQDTSAVFRGSINQSILGVEIKTSGNKNPVKLVSITFSANGTTEPVVRNIENARLWFTGKENNFNTSVQVGHTLTQVSENNFEMAVNRQLSPGKNYFWLTFDIKSDATIKNGNVDADCVSMKINTTSFIPMLSSPAGKKKILSNIPYFSTGQPNIYQPEAWNSKRDGSGTEPVKLNDLRNSYFIQSGHSVINTEKIVLPAVIIEKHALLKARQPVKTNYMLVTDGGIYQQEFAEKEVSDIDYLKMDNGANYIHLNDGKLPGVKRFFSPRSNQCLYQYTQLTFSERIRWGNILINALQAPMVDISNGLTNVQGDLELHKTGTDNYLYAGRTDTINIGGSLIFSGGSFTAAGLANTSLIINVAEDLILKSGNFYDSDGKKNSNCTLNINGDVLLLAGIFNFNKSSDGLSQINFIGTVLKKSYWSEKNTIVELGNVSIMPGKELVIQNGRFGDIAAKRKLTVEGGGALMCGQFPVSGNGEFILKENATIGIGNVHGINSATTEGNILTKEKYFDSRAHYIYYTGSTPQQTGIFETAPENGKIKTLTIKKDKPSDSVVLSQDMEVTDQFLISMGQLDKKKNKINISKLSDSFVKGTSN